MNTLRRQAKIMRRKVLLSALEEALAWVLKVSPNRSDETDYRLTLAKLQVEIEWVKIRIERLELLEENPRKFVRSRLVWTKPDRSDMTTFLEFAPKPSGPWKREEELK